MLTIGSKRCNELLQEFGSPLLVYDEDKLEQQLSDYKDYFKSEQFSCEVIYASKAFTCPALLKKIEAYGLGLDVVSGGELYGAREVHFPATKIYFHGNNKSMLELEEALNYGVETIVIDNPFELDVLLDLSATLHKKVSILIRINPKIEAHTHEYIMTATSDSKFGISIDHIDEIAKMMHKVEDSNHLSFAGFHSHIGSQIFEIGAFVETIDRMIHFASSMQTSTKVLVPVMNFGGGFGVRYEESDHPMSIQDTCKALVRAMEAGCDQYHLDLKKACIEPGRSIVAEAGYSLYEIGFIKETLTKKFAFINGGMSDNIRPALYGAVYRCDLANKINQPKTQHYEIAGKCCESGDILIHDAYLPEVEAKDILVVYSCGAYGYSMASNYNKLARPAVVFVKSGQARLVIRRETYQDMYALSEGLK